MKSDPKHPATDAVLEAVSPERREFVRRLMAGASFAVPVALGLGTIASRDALAQSSSGAESSAGAGDPGKESTAATAVPEPASVALVGLGLASAAIAARRGKSHNNS